MSGTVYDAEFSGGPSDDGVAAEAWRMAQRLDDAREAYAADAWEKRTSRVLKVLLAALNAPKGGGVR